MSSLERTAIGVTPPRDLLTLQGATLCAGDAADEAQIEEARRLMKRWRPVLRELAK